MRPFRFAVRADAPTVMDLTFADAPTPLQKLEEVIALRKVHWSGEPFRFDGQEGLIAEGEGRVKRLQCRKAPSRWQGVISGRSGEWSTTADLRPGGWS